MFITLVGCAMKPVDDLSTAEVFSDPQVAALVIAAEKGNVEEIDRLIAAGVNVNAGGTAGMTPLLRTMQAKSVEGFKALLHHGRNPNLLDRRGRAVVNQAAREQVPIWLELALKHGANPNLVNKGNIYYPNETQLFYAVATGSIDNVRLLLKAGADPNHRGEYERTPLHRAVRGGRFAKACALIDGGANFDLKDNNGKTVIDYLRSRKSSFPETQQEIDKIKDLLRARGVKFEADSHSP